MHVWVSLSKGRLSELGVGINWCNSSWFSTKAPPPSPSSFSDLVELWQREHFTGVSCGFTFSFSWQVKAIEKKKTKPQGSIGKWGVQTNRQKTASWQYLTGEEKASLPAVPQKCSDVPFIHLVQIRPHFHWMQYLIFCFSIFIKS